MNAGLSNLATLKGWLLAAAMQTATDYDDQIAAIGKGVALALEKHCNRKFVRVEDGTYECDASVDHVILPRAPLEAAPTLEMRGEGEDTWTAQTDFLANWSAESAVVLLSAAPGGWRDRLRFTFTGGYHVETLEPDDIGYPTALPTGASAVPADLLLAWQLQCEHVWTQRDKLGLQLANPQSTTAAVAQTALLDAVVQQLRPFIRFNL